ncbi:nucleolar protein NOP52 variant [Blumeria hordei DH14]|uniref:Nucleolar protein NOP52 variant n=1 Tax=Blumeria graminis f. sp. hordei (strain DH14) TaxID=546991 RepID=N1J650_BLUG1|nr:nucleolar protein NOP52 variant [Blumeria hordei DH14]
MSPEIQNSPLIKQLVANDKPTRDAALVSLRKYLAGRRDLPSTELLKLWKALFYCLWMADRPLTQQSLAKSLAQLVNILPANSVAPFLEAFWQTMQREWTNIDVLRMEKFLLLTRLYLAACWEVLKRNEWEAGWTERILKLISDIPCNVEDHKIPNGMRYHVIDVYVDELERVGALEPNAIAPIEIILEPLRNLAQHSPTKSVRIKAKEALQDSRLPDSIPEASIACDGWNGFQD